jgi:predicted phage terminase large subunit-like protein
VTSAPTLLDLVHEARNQQRVKEEAESLSTSLSSFIKAAWPVLKPHEPFKMNWHIEAVCHHLQAVSAGEIRRLQIWVPPGTMKSISASVMWPSWEWTFAPWIGYWAASYDLSLSWRLARMNREILISSWYQQRWRDRFRLTKEADGEFTNDQGGHRLSTSPTSKGIGLHGHRILIDDAVDATAADANSKAKLNETNNWYDGTVPGRMSDPATTAIVNIQQRLHEADLAGHLLEVEDWTILCLPERFEHNHPFAWRGKNVHPDISRRIDGTVLDHGDPRQEEGELLWPAHRDEAASAAFARTLRAHRAAGQLQQRPASREGEIIKRDWWRFYDSRIRSKEEWSKLPRFSLVVISADCPLKDKESSDNVAVQCWGVRGADRYLLDLALGKMNYNKAKRTIKEMSQWARKHWRCAHYVLIEVGGFGPELIIDLKRELTGVTKIPTGKEGDKEVRADAATDALESGNVFLPGIGPPAHPVFNEHASPADIVDFVNNCATFPFGAYDDDVDAWSQTMNWLRSRNVTPMRTASALRRVAQRSGIG